MSDFVSSIEAAMTSRIAGLRLQVPNDLLRDPRVGLPDRGLRIARHDGTAGVAADRDLRVERYLPEKRHLELTRRALSPAVFEDLLPVAALGADVVGHVLDDAEDRDVDLLKHRQALAGVDQRDVLRGRHD